MMSSNLNQSFGNLFAPTCQNIKHDKMVRKKTGIWKTRSFGHWSIPSGCTVNGSNGPTCNLF